jgi:hypothetical protein
MYFATPERLDISPTFKLAVSYFVSLLVQGRCPSDENWHVLRFVSGDASDYPDVNKLYSLLFPVPGYMCHYSINHR